MIYLLAVVSYLRACKAFQPGVFSLFLLSSLSFLGVRGWCSSVTERTVADGNDIDGSDQQSYVIDFPC